MESSPPVEGGDAQYAATRTASSTASSVQYAPDTRQSPGASPVRPLLDSPSVAVSDGGMNGSVSDSSSSASLSLMPPASSASSCVRAPRGRLPGRKRRRNQQVVAKSSSNRRDGPAHTGPALVLDSDTSSGGDVSGGCDSDSDHAPRPKKSRQEMPVRIEQLRSPMRKRLRSRRGGASAGPRSMNYGSGEIQSSS